MTKYEKMFAESTMQEDNQTVIVPVGCLWNRHKEVVTGVTVTNIVSLRNVLYGRCHIDVVEHQYFGPNPTEEEKKIPLALVKIEDGVWQLK